VSAEILAITQLFRFRFNTQYLEKLGYPEDTLAWKVGMDTNPNVWVVIFSLVILFVNLIPVRRYGQLEYCVGTIKVLFFTLLIFFNVFISALQLVPRGGRFWTYNDPYGFTAQNYTIPFKNATFPYEGNFAATVITGNAGRLAGVWSAITTTVFSMTGLETVAISAAENRDLRRTETIKIATRKTAIRVVVLYALAIATVGLNVPYTDPYLRDMTINSINYGQDSPFVLAAVYNHLKGWPHFFNAFYIFSATTCGVNALYNGSRTLHAMARISSAWPGWGPINALRERLERTYYGVPLAAVFLCWLFSLIGFLSTKPSTAKVWDSVSKKYHIANHEAFFWRADLGKNRHHFCLIPSDSQRHHLHYIPPVLQQVSENLFGGNAIVT
jgi:amino acid transporter